MSPTMRWFSLISSLQPRRGSDELRKTPFNASIQVARTSWSPSKRFTVIGISTQAPRYCRNDGITYVSYWPLSAGHHYGVCWSSRMQTVDQHECNRLVSDNANGQVHAITQAHIKNRRTTTRPWKTTGLQGLPALPIGARVAPKILLTASRTSAKPELYKRCPRQYPGSQSL